MRADSRTFLTTAGPIVLRLFMAAVFLSSGIAKILDSEAFAQSIYLYKLVPVPAANLAAVTLPWVEIFCGLLFLTGLLVPESALISGGMLLFFIGAILSSMARGLQHECGCHALFFEENVGWKKIAENLVLLETCLAVGLAYKLKACPTPREAASPAVHPAEQVLRPG